MKLFTKDNVWTELNYKSQIYCSSRQIAEEDDGKWYLCVHNAEQYLTNDYIPILLRNCRTKRGWKWLHYVLSSEDKNTHKNDVTITQGSDLKTSESLYYIKINGEGLNNFPQIHINNNKRCVSHGKRRIYLENIDKGTTRSFTAKWGLAFIKAKDWPANNIALDLTKLVTNIAVFKIFYSVSTDSNIMSIKI